MAKKLICFICSAFIIFLLASCKAPDTAAEEISLLLNEKNAPLLISGIDALSRKITTVSDFNTKQVGLFYFLWSGQQPSMQTDIYDAGKLIDQMGVERFFSIDSTLDGTSPYGQFHYWGEPLFGYYHATDTWVMRRHIEMLTMAGVDFLVFDTTNLFHYAGVYKLLLAELEHFLNQGFSVPKIAFLYKYRLSKKSYRNL